MAGLEEDISKIRDRDSRVEFEEALRAFRAGALGPAIVAAWTSVAADLYSKIRELAAGGDGAAKAHVKNVDAWIKAGDTDSLLKDEASLLDRVLNDYELIDARSHTELQRLRDDRHVCAHPAFREPGERLRPSAETVAAHLRSALDSVLTKPPVQGRRALDAFIRDTTDSSWPSRHQDVRQHLKLRYLSGSKAAVALNICKLVAKSCSTTPASAAPGSAVTDAELADRLAVVAEVLWEEAPGAFSDAITDHLAKASAAGLDAEQLRRAAGNLGHVPALYEALAESDLPRLEAAIEGATTDELLASGLLVGDQAGPAVEEWIAARVRKLNDADFLRALREQTSDRLVAEALRRLTDVGSYDDAATYMSAVVQILGVDPTRDEVETVLNAVRGNSQHRGSWHVPNSLTSLYAQTEGQLWAADVWKPFADEIPGLVEYEAATTKSRFTSLAQRIKAEDA